MTNNHAPDALPSLLHPLEALRDGVRLAMQPNGVTLKDGILTIPAGVSQFGKPVDDEVHNFTVSVPTITEDD